MGFEIVVTRELFTPVPGGVPSFGLRDATARALSRQPEGTLSNAIDPVSMAVFNRNQALRLLQEFRFLAQRSDEVTRQDLEDAASFIERGMEAIGPNPARYVVFVGD